MKKIGIVTDSNSGIFQAEGKKDGIYVIPMPFYVNGKMFLEEISMNQEEFYERLKEKNTEVKTSQPTPETVMNVWNDLLKEYDEIVHIPMSSGLSGSLQTARMLSQEEAYEGKVFVVDNQRISITLKESVYQAKALAERGYEGKEIAEILTRDKFKSSIYIMLDTLDYLAKGGRLTPAAAAIGKVLRIKPVLSIQGEKLDAFGKARNFRQGKSLMVKTILKEWNERFQGEKLKIAFAYTEDLDAEMELVDEAKKEIPEAFQNQDNLFIDLLSLSIACHIGPGAVAIGISNIPKELVDGQ